jgi:predicted RNase H-like HicB family nuclease
MKHMNQIIIDIDWTERNFAAAPRDERIACVATGATLEAVQNAIIEAMKFHLEGMGMHGESIPEEYQGEWQPVFVLTTRAKLRYTDNYITRKALSRETGINIRQLSHYANGWKHPRPSTEQKIAEGIRAISKRLALI